MVFLIIILVIVISIFVAKHLYFLQYDHIIGFTGGLGSGKSLESVKVALKLLRKQRRKVKVYNIFHKSKKPQPLLYSSIPVKISRNEWAVKLNYNHLLLAERIELGSIVFIDEVGAFADQFKYKDPNILDNFNEFVRLYRHYTKGGYIVVNDQCSENINLWIRRRINTVFNLMYFKKFFGIVYSIQVRNINISEEIKTVESDNIESGFRTKFGLLPLFIKYYDTYCYSERYLTVPDNNGLERWTAYKTNNLMVCPKERIIKCTCNDKDK